MKYSVLPPDLFIIGSIWNVSVGVKALQCSVAERPHFPFLHSFRSSHGPRRGQCKDCAVWPSGDGRAALHSRDVLNGNVFKERMLYALCILIHRTVWGLVAEAQMHRNYRSLGHFQDTCCFHGIWLFVFLSSSLFFSPHRLSRNLTWRTTGR